MRTLATLSHIRVSSVRSECWRYPAPPCFPFWLTFAHHFDNIPYSIARLGRVKPISPEELRVKRRPLRFLSQSMHLLACSRLWPSGASTVYTRTTPGFPTHARYPGAGTLCQNSLGRGFSPQGAEARPYLIRSHLRVFEPSGFISSMYSRRTRRARVGSPRESLYPKALRDLIRSTRRCRLRERGEDHEVLYHRRRT